MTSSLLQRVLGGHGAQPHLEVLRQRRALRAHPAGLSGSGKPDRLHCKPPKDSNLHCKPSPPTPCCISMIPP